MTMAMTMTMAMMNCLYYGVMTITRVTSNTSLNQIRYGLSPLRFHLFNIAENPLCLGCHYIEHSKHFFIECICYNQARVVMTTKLDIKLMGKTLR